MIPATIEYDDEVQAAPVSDIKLTAEQAAILQPAKKINVIEAVPGSGKTTTVTALVLSMDDAVSKTTAVMTFTSAGASALKRKIGSKSLFFIGTTHSFCYRVLREHGTKIGLKPHLSILGEDASKELMAEVLVLNPSVNPESLAAAVKANPKVKKTRPLEVSPAAWVLAQEYHSRMLIGGLLDYDSMLTYGAYLLSRFPELGPDQFIVDEAQDSDTDEWAVFAACKSDRYWFVGDLDQSLYEWRGATPAKLLEICKTPDTNLMTITRNFRSGPDICDRATRLISHNVKRVDKKVISGVDRQSVAKSLRFRDESCELAAVVEWAKTHMSGAILCRSNFQAAKIRTGLQQAGVKIKGRVEKPRDAGTAVAIITAFDSPDNDDAVYRCLSKVAGREAAKSIRAEALKLVQPVIKVALESMNNRVRAMADNLTAEFDKPKIDSVMYVLGVEVSPETVDWVTEARERAADDTLDSLLLALQEGADATKGEGIHVSTIHGAKGLEWPDVWLPGWYADGFPRNSTRNIEEERRLAYVAFTRAMDSVTVSHAMRVMVFERLKDVAPSRFITELGF